MYTYGYSSMQAFMDVRLCGRMTVWLPVYVCMYVRMYLCMHVCMYL